MISRRLNYLIECIDIINPIVENSTLYQQVENTEMITAIVLINLQGICINTLMLMIMSTRHV